MVRARQGSPAKPFLAGSIRAAISRSPDNLSAALNVVVDKKRASAANVGLDGGRNQALGGGSTIGSREFFLEANVVLRKEQRVSSENQNVETPTSAKSLCAIVREKRVA